MKSTSIIALMASAGVILGSATASAADLGGNCCADLEERVAELEATTARKGNRKVSLQIYGQVSEAIVWWNDGAEANTYVVENYLVKNRVGFTGSAKINSDWTAGFRLELGIRAYRSSSVNQLALGASQTTTITAFNTQSVSLRDANWYLQSNTYGRITVGRSPDAVAGTASINLANPEGFSGLTGPGYTNNSFLLRRAGTTGSGANALSALTWGDAANFRNGDGPSSMDYSQTSGGIKYTSPFFLGQSKTSGFRMDGYWGMDDMWSVALRYAETLGSFRVAAGVGFSQWNGPDRGMCSQGASNVAITAATTSSNVDCTSIQASASVMHVPTGLYISGGGGQIHDKNSQAAYDVASGLAVGTNRPGDDGKSSTWYVQAGWQAKLNALGNTTFWGQFVQYDTGLGVRNSVVQTLAAADALNSLNAIALISGSQTQYWGAGVSQEISAAAMVLYAGFHTGSTEVMLRRQSIVGVQSAKSNPIDDWQTFYTGATIRF